MPAQDVLETLGSLSSAHLYQSYLNIGLLADAVEHQSYSQAQANEMLDTVVGLMNSVDDQLARLARADLPEGDREDVEHIRDLSGFLRVQIAALRAYWLTHDAQHAARYQEARQKTWAALSK
jgi:hypothetical protein